MCLQEKYPWIDTATSEDFPTEDLKLMASIIGMSATIKLLTEATGCVFTMTKYWDRELIKKNIKRGLLSLQYEGNFFIKKFEKQRSV